MKFRPQLTASSKQRLYHRSWLIKKLVSSAILSGTLLATGCQSISLGQNNSQNLAVMPTPIASKTALASALQHQRRHSFAYHSDITLSNQQSFTEADSSTLVVADEVSEHCDAVHDKDYIDLLDQAAAQVQDISATDYDDARLALKQSYIKCMAAYQAWDANRHRDDETDFDNNDSEADDISEVDIVENDVAAVEVVKPAVAESYGEVGVSLTETSSIHIKGNRTTVNTKTSAIVLPHYQQLFDGYEEGTSALDIKKLQLRDAYLFKPLSINAQGVYQPLAGKFTMLSRVQYQTRNHKTSINQPIYVDFKTGNIYIWADHLAIINSQILDDKLGTKWKNKWLKLAIDDGSLPKGFGRALIKSHFTALDETYAAAPVSQFDSITPDMLLRLSPQVPEHQLVRMRQSPQIIRRLQSAQSYAQFYQDYTHRFYQLISNQYPELTTNNEPVNLLENGPSFSTKHIVQQVLAMMQMMTNTNADIHAGESFTHSDAPNSAFIQELYGLNRHGQLEWQHLRNQDTNSQTLTNGLTIDALQYYTPINRQMPDFPNLPANMQTPNANNSIDIRDYSRELTDYYREGNGTAIGKMLFNKLMPDNTALINEIQ